MTVRPKGSISCGAARMTPQINRIVLLTLNRQDWQMNAPAVPPPFKDRKIGLVLFGIFTASIGILCALFVPLLLLAPTLAAKSPNAAPPPTPAQMLPGIAFFVIMAVVLVWLGIGSIMLRRWARALLLVGAWSWLVVGVISLVAMVFAWPHMTAAIEAAQPPGQAPLPAAARAIILGTMLGTVAVLYVILPGIWVLFYQSRHVKATCETRDAVVRWTDRCPLPVLAVSVWLAFSGAIMLLLPFAYHGVLPFFGMFLTGPAGVTAELVLAAFWLYASWALYRLRISGWWIAFALSAIMMFSGVMTYMHHDLGEIFRAMGYSDQQAREYTRIGFRPAAMSWLSAVVTVPVLCYLVFIRRFFRGQEAPPV